MQIICSGCGTVMNTIPDSKNTKGFGSTEYDICDDCYAKIIEQRDQDEEQAQEDIENDMGLDDY